jgi:hypothetical protein
VRYDVLFLSYHSSTARCTTRLLCAAPLVYCALPSTNHLLLSWRLNTNDTPVMYQHACHHSHRVAVPRLRNSPVYKSTCMHVQARAREHGADAQARGNWGCRRWRSSHSSPGAASQRVCGSAGIRAFRGGWGQRGGAHTTLRVSPHPLRSRRIVCAPPLWPQSPRKALIPAEPQPRWDAAPGKEWEERHPLRPQSPRLCGKIGVLADA